MESGRHGRPILSALLVVASALGGAALRAEEYPTVPYRLVQGSTYQEGCFVPCDCPIIEEQAMHGVFDMVFYPFAGPLWTVAFEHVAWSVPTLGKEITGHGIYRRAGEMHELSLELQIDGGAPTTFDSGWVSGGSGYPSVDILVSMNGLYCYDIALHLRAEPDAGDCDLTVDDVRLSWSETPGAADYDVLCGNLEQLRTHGGDFAMAIDACMADDLAATTLEQDIPVAAGQAVWFLVRPRGGSWDSSDDALVAPRDPSIVDSPLACP